ncbi:MAG: hypothetical protein Q8R28_13540 [Dehalococcoidia bacterium]|nr:hypothetical protein [Dehalococcoidia bacterium]
MDVIEIVGYHGTTVAAAEAIMEHGFSSSRNEEDWLGDGAYFFQDAPSRAWEWAKEKAGRRDDNPAVVVALVRLEDCMDFADIGWAEGIKQFYPECIAFRNRHGLPMPLQDGKAHRLDREVINFAIGRLAEEDQGGWRSVRGVFIEGKPVFRGSAIYDRSHIQVAVRDPSLITVQRILVDPAA